MMTPTTTQIKKRINERKLTTLAPVLLALLALVTIALWKTPTAEPSTIESIAAAGSADHNSKPSLVEATQSPYRGLSPAAALSNGKPTLIYFHEAESCRIRYCRSVELLESRLHTYYNGAVNFVLVPIQFWNDGAGKPELVLNNWDLYLVNPYYEWLLAVEENLTAHGTPQSTALLIDPQGEVIYSAGEYFSWDELHLHLKMALEGSLPEETFPTHR